MNNSDKDFYAGVICALAVVEQSGEDTLYDEIVGTVCEKELLECARKDGAMKWSGLSRWKRRKK